MHLTHINAKANDNLCLTHFLVLTDYDESIIIVNVLAITSIKFYTHKKMRIGGERLVEVQIKLNDGTSSLIRVTNLQEILELSKFFRVEQA